MVSNRKLRVLIADDSTFIRERLPAMLSDTHGIEVVGIADDGAEALNLARALNPDVVILDIRMPRMTGIEVLQKLKKDEAAPVVIMLTSYPYPQYREKCQEAGADFFFDKSTDFEKLFDLLKELRQGQGANLVTDQ
jgi:DNA-binding NarL/FixJ family response regulator